MGIFFENNERLLCFHAPSHNSRRNAVKQRDRPSFLFLRIDCGFQVAEDKFIQLTVHHGIYIAHLH